MATKETTVEKVTTSESDVLEAEPLRNALAFLSETVVLGGSNLLKGDVRQAAIHAAGGLMARSLFGLPGLLLVGSNSFVKATTGRHLHEHLGMSKDTDHSADARVEHQDDGFEERRNTYGEIAEMTVNELQQRAAVEGIEGRSGMNKDELIEALAGRAGRNNH